MRLHPLPPVDGDPHGPSALDILESTTPLDEQLEAADLTEALDPDRRADTHLRASVDRSALSRAAYSQLVDVLRRFLDEPVVDHLLAAWSTTEELLEAGRSTRDNDEIIVVDLSHVEQPALTKDPAVEIYWGEVLLTTLVFNVLVTVDARALCASVSRARLVALTVEDCDVVVSLRLNDHVLAQGRAGIDPQLRLSLGAGLPLTHSRRPRGVRGRP